MTATVEGTITVPDDVSTADGPEVAHALCGMCYNPYSTPDDATAQALCGTWVNAAADYDAIQCGRCAALFEHGPCSKCGRTW